MKKRLEIAGVPIDNLIYEEVLDHIDHLIKTNRKVYIVTPNPEMVLNASCDEDFLEILKKAELATPDGVGILWAANYLSKPKPKRKIVQYWQLYSSLIAILIYPKSLHRVLRQRVTGSDLFKKVIDRSQSKKWRIFLLGASKGVAGKVAKQFSRIYPEAKFVGSFAGSPDISEEQEICDLINEVKPDILFVAYGSPYQEFWIHRNLFKLSSVKVAIGVGGAFDFYVGKVKRAPKWMQKVSLEWLWRLSREPKRFSRIWKATYVFIRLVAKEKNNFKF